MKEKEKVAYNQEELIKKIEKHYAEYDYDFSNYYFRTNMWKKDYIEKFGSLPAHFCRNRKVPVWVNAVSGEVLQQWKMDAIEVNVCRNHENYYKIEYDKDLNCIVLANWLVDISNNRITKGEFCYIDEKKNLIITDCKKGGEKHVGVAKVTDFSYPRVYTGKVEDIINGSCLCKDVEQMYNEAFSPLFPIAFAGGNKYRFIRTGWHISEFLLQKEVQKKAGPKQNKVDELCAIELKQPEIKNFGDERSNYYWSGSSAVVASRVNDEYAVLRWFKKDSLNEKTLCSAVSIRLVNLFISTEN